MRSPDLPMSAGKRLWRALAPAGLRRMAGPMVLRLAEGRARSAVRSAGSRASVPGPVIVSGLLSETKGVSEGARLTVAGLVAAGFDPVAHDIRPALTRGPTGKASLGVDQPGGVWLLHLNAPEMVHALAAIDPKEWAGRRRIGYWAYELTRLPAFWARNADLLHEIWVPSRFVAEAVRASGVTTPVRVMPHPVHLRASAKPDRSRFDIKADEFVVLAMGDLNSAASRKNLTGAIDIYRRAFPEDGSGARLIVKTQSDAQHPDFAAMAAEAAGGREDIMIVGWSMQGDDVASLVAAADVALSPHRAEGFGLVLAEAFLAGVPALATGWSGNMDFMADLPELTIAHGFTPVRDPSGVYKASGLEWAEPDVADGAVKLRRLRDDPALRRALAERGRAAIVALGRAWTREALEETALGGLVGRSGQVQRNV